MHQNPKGMSITIRFDNGGLDKCSTESTKMVRKSDNAMRRDQKRMTHYNKTYNTRSQAKANGPEKQRDSDDHISLSETGCSHILSPEMLFTSPTQAEQPSLLCMDESPVGPINTPSHDDIAECPDSPGQSLVHDDSTVELPSSPSILHDDNEELPTKSKAQHISDFSDSVCRFFENWTLNTPFLKEYPFLNDYSLEDPCLNLLRYSKLLEVANDSQKHSLASHLAGGHPFYNIVCTKCQKRLDNKSEQTPESDPSYKRAYYFCNDDCHVYGNALYVCGSCNPGSLCPRQECRKNMTQIW